jgi:rubredoxin
MGRIDLSRVECPLCGGKKCLRVRRRYTSLTGTPRARLECRLCGMAWAENESDLESRGSA